MTDKTGCREMIVMTAVETSITIKFVKRKNTWFKKEKEKIKTFGM